MSINLNSSEIHAELTPPVQQLLNGVSAIEIFDQIESTQDYLKQSIAKSEVSQVSAMRLVLAESQLSGKGRMQRKWQASAGENILLSCSWSYSEVPKDLAGLSLALIVSLAQCLIKQFDLPVSIKWPNDLLVNGSKIAGMLVDVETGKECRLIIGLGLNVSQSFDAQEIDQAWTDLKQQGISDLNRNSLVAKIVSGFASVLLTYHEDGFRGYQASWNALSEHKGKMVKMTKPGLSTANDILVGMMEGVDERGFLLLRTDTGLKIISDSSFSLKPVS